ncbi:MAG: hypothetical protein LBU62_06210 [Bacteroidales bacterium]|nr:hypothetical protein [Bacteroidales bacterium]
MKTRIILGWMLVAAMVSGGCKEKDNRSSNTNVTSIVILKDGQVRYTVCNGNCWGKGGGGTNEVTNTAQVCKNEVITALEAVFTCQDPKATIEKCTFQVDNRWHSGPQDFTTPQTFTVTAENGTQRDYTITLTKNSALSCE